MGRGGGAGREWGAGEQWGKGCCAGACPGASGAMKRVGTVTKSCLPHCGARQVVVNVPLLKPSVVLADTKTRTTSCKDTALWQCSFCPEKTYKGMDWPDPSDCIGYCLWACSQSIHHRTRRKRTSFMSWVLTPDSVAQLCI